MNLTKAIAENENRMAKINASPEWKTVFHHLHFNGSKSHLLTNAEQWRIYVQIADGFGKMSKKFHEKNGWDWSHIRESSYEAIVIMAWMIETLAKNK